jgi:hypothetical protein
MRNVKTEVRDGEVFHLIAACEITLLKILSRTTAHLPSLKS